MALKEIQPSFVSDFEVYLKTERNISHNTCILYNNAIMMLMHRAHENGWVSRYPFSDYHIQKEETEKGFLTKEELNALMNNPRLTPRRAYIRDLFIFCCFTGLAHADLKNLKNENIVKNPADGSWWIHTHRQKTGVAENVKLLPIPLAILKKYKGLCTDGHVFDVPNHKSCCKRIRFVAKLCGITKNLTWHMARHTMATVVCLSNGMPLEVVGSVLGHKCIESTQVYAKITQEKLGCEIDTLATKLAKIQQFSPNIGMVI
jgi:site-specific recombinase XerD